MARTKFEKDQSVIYKGLTAHVLDPNFAGKGTVEIQVTPYAQNKPAPLVVHEWELQDKPDVPRSPRSAQSATTTEEKEATQMEDGSKVTEDAKELLETGLHALDVIPALKSNGDAIQEAGNIPERVAETAKAVDAATSAKKGSK